MNNIINPESKKLQYQLFSVRQVTTASGFFGILAGATLMAINYKRQGTSDKFYSCIGLGIAYLLGMVILAVSIPDIPALLYNVTSAVIIHKWYKKEQYPLFKQHIRNGGEIEQNSQVVVFSFLIFFLSLIIIFIAVFFLAIFWGY